MFGYGQSEPWPSNRDPDITGETTYRVFFSQPARSSGRDYGVRIQLKRVNFWVFSTSRFPPQALSSDGVSLFKTF